METGRLLIGIINRVFGDEVLENELKDVNIEYYIIENAGETIDDENCSKKTLPDSDIEMRCISKKFIL